MALGATVAAAATGPEAASANWAGYVATGQNFSRVSGTWVQPSVDPSGGDGDSAFWVGLGGSGNSGSQSGSLEQLGTQANVSGGQTSYYAWYELLPSPPVKINVPIKPGDHVNASVAVSGSSVTMSLTNQTTGQSFSQTFQVSNVDTSSAEWIAEAPSASDGQGDLTPVSLSDFGTVNFSSASATAGGHTGTISDSSWTSQPIALTSNGDSAQASSLSSDGSSFSVTAGGSSNVSYPGGGSGNGYGGGSGDGGDGGYGYGGGGGYGGSGYGGGDPYGYGGGYGGGDSYGYGGGGSYGYGGGSSSGSSYGYDGGGAYGYGGGGGYGGGYPSGGDGTWS